MEVREDKTYKVPFGAAVGIFDEVWVEQRVNWEQWRREEATPPEQLLKESRLWRAEGGPSRTVGVKGGLFLVYSFLTC